MRYRARQVSPIAVPIAVVLVALILPVEVRDLDDVVANVVAAVLALSAAVLVVLSALEDERASSA